MNPEDKSPPELSARKVDDDLIISPSQNLSFLNQYFSQQDEQLIDEQDIIEMNDLIKKKKKNQKKKRKRKEKKQATQQQQFEQEIRL